MKTDFSQYLGVPVNIQLRETMVMVACSEKQKLKYAADAETPQWIPEGLFAPPSAPDGQPQPMGIVNIKYAVLSEIEGKPDWLEVRFAAPGPEKGSLVVLGMLVRLLDLGYVTRIVMPPEEPSRILFTNP